MSFNKNTGLYEGFIYQIRNKVNGKCYIGQTNTTVLFRFQQHQYRSTQAKYTQPLYNAFNKYSIANFEVGEITKVCSNTLWELTIELNKLEEQYIRDYETKVPNGYNILDGGDVNPTFLTSKKVYQFDNNGNLINVFDSITKASNYLGFATYSSTLVKYMDSYIEYKHYYWMSKNDFSPSKIIIQRKEEKKKRKKSSPKQNKKKYKKHKARIQKPVYQYDAHFNLVKFYTDYNMVDKEIISHDSLSKILKQGVTYSKGYIWSSCEINSEMYGNVKNYKAPFYQFELDGTYVREWNNISEATREYSRNNNHSSIRNVLNGKMGQAFGYLWSYSKTPPIYLNRGQKHGKKVKQFSLDGNFIKQFDCLADAQRATNISYQSISSVCKGEYKQSGGYIWKYAS